MNLLTKILLPIMLLVIMICGVSGYMSYKNAANELHEALLDNMSGEAEALVRAIKTMTQGAIADITRISNRKEFPEFFSGDFRKKENGLALSPELKTIEESYQDFDRLSILDEEDYRRKISSVLI